MAYGTEIPQIENRRPPLNNNALLDWLLQSARPIALYILEIQNIHTLL